jgi:hypothetical protein
MRPSRVIVAFAVLALAAGTAIAAAPSSSSSPSGSPVAGPSGSPSSEQASVAPTRASEAPEASDAPEGSEALEGAEAPESPPTAAEEADIVGRLQAAGISTTAAAFESLAGKVGVGGAVRTLAFAHASGKTPDQILAMFQGGMGWGRIRHELGLSIGPGIGWIMGHGH